MNLILDIFMADHKPKAGFCLNMTFKLCMALGPRKVSCGMMEGAKKQVEGIARKQMMMRRTLMRKCHLGAAGSKHTKSTSAEEKRRNSKAVINSR